MLRVITLLLLPLTAFAQPQFTANDIPWVGDADTVNYLLYQSIAGDLDAETGNEFNWDYSSLPFLTFSGFFNLVEHRVPATPAAVNFPAAQNEEYSIGSGETVIFWQLENDTLFALGEGSTGAPAGYTPRLPELVFPMAFGETDEHTHIYFANGQPVSQREMSMSYDGYGTVTTPYGTQNGAMRIRRMERDSSYLLGTVTETITYSWYKPGGYIPVLTIATTGAPGLYFCFASRQNGLANAVTNHDEMNITPFPVPASETIQWAGPTAQSAQLTDHTGRIIRSYPDARNQVDIRDIPSGIYLLRLTLRDGRESQCRVMIE
jgi:hypothetical protein